MLIHFNCPNCNATQIRGTESTGPYNAAGDGTNKYRCGSCRSLIDGDAVQAGEYDIPGAVTDPADLARDMVRIAQRLKAELSELHGSDDEAASRSKEGREEE
jgi:hypothetical protein